MATLQIDVEAVNCAINRIDTLTTDIETRTKQLLHRYADANKESDSTVGFIVAINQKLEEEQQNIKQLVEAQEEVKAALTRYSNALNDIADDSDFR